MSQLNSFTCHFIVTIARSRTFFDNLKCVKQSPLSFAVDRYIQPQGNTKSDKNPKAIRSDHVNVLKRLGDSTCFFLNFT